MFAFSQRSTEIVTYLVNNFVSFLPSICPHRAGPNFEFATETREELLYDKEKLLVSGGAGGVCKKYLFLPRVLPFFLAMHDNRGACCELVALMVQWHHFLPCGVRVLVLYIAS